MQSDAPPPKPRKSRLRRLGGCLGWLSLVGLAAGGVGGWFGYQWFDREILSTLPAELGRDTQFRIPSSVRVYANDGEQVDEFYLERRTWVPLAELPPYVWQAFIASEDRRFFEHQGVDPVGIIRALVVNLRGGETRQGGSTITQQLVKNLLVGKERSYRRKLREAVLAYRLEKELPKMQLLELYINYIALGSGNYGVEAAAEDYFGISARDLDPGQAAMLAGLVPAPSKYSPRHNPELAAQRRETVLRLMVDQGFLSAVDASLHLMDPVVVPRVSADKGTYTAYLTETRREIRRVFGQDLPFLQGLQVHTPLDKRVQDVVDLAIRKGLKDLETRQGARGPTRNIPAEKRDAFLERGDGLKVDVNSGKFREPRAGECFLALAGDHLGDVRAGPFVLHLPKADLDVKVRVDEEHPPVALRHVIKPGDVLEVCKPTDEAATDEVRRRDRPWAEAAAVVIENSTGNVVALSGGYDVGLEGFVRATQAKRQPGSSFKPYVYGNAVTHGLAQTEIVTDAPIAFGGWAPKNYGGGYKGNIPLRTAMALSLNTVAVRLAYEYGVDGVVKLANGLGVRTKLRDDLTIALGSSEVTPMDQALAYSSIAREGVRIDPVYVLEVQDRAGNHLGAAGEIVRFPGIDPIRLPGPPGERVIPADQAYVLVDMMRNVFLAGTARRGSRPGMDFGGKTGTTSGFVDAWFVGYSPRYTVAVWIGTDGTHSIGDKETGGKAALPVWSQIMDALPNVPGERFPVPDGVLLLPYENLWLGYARGTAPEKLLKVPTLVATAPLPAYGFSPPSARPVGQADVAPPPLPTAALPSAAPEGDVEEGAGDPASGPPDAPEPLPTEPPQVP